MRFVPLTAVLEKERLEKEFAAIGEKGKVSLGNTCIFIRGLAKQMYLPYADIVWAFRRVETCSGTFCCGRTDFTIQHLILTALDKRQYDILLDDRDTAARALETIGSRNPGAEIGYSIEKKEKILGTD